MVLTRGRGVFWSRANQLTVTWIGGNSHLIVFRLMRLYSLRGGGRMGKKRKERSRSVCGPSNPVVWYTAPLKLSVVFIVALEISLVKLQAWPVNQRCLSLPDPKGKNSRLCGSHEDLAGYRRDEAGVCVCVCVCVCRGRCRNPLGQTSARAVLENHKKRGRTIQTESFIPLNISLIGQNMRLTI